MTCTTPRTPAALCASRRRPTTVGIIALLTMLVAVLLVAGCSNSAGPDENEGDTGYPSRTSLAKVVQKLGQAYAAMDTTAYADCLATDFEFWLNPADLNDPQNPLPSYWGFAEETQIARNMFSQGAGALEVQDIALTLTPLGDAVEVPGPNPGDPSMWVRNYDIDLYVYLPNDLTLWANGAARFAASVDPDETGPAGETLWKVSKWEDIDDPARSENSTWGGIKALFR